MTDKSNKNNGTQLEILPVELIGTLSLFVKHTERFRLKRKQIKSFFELLNNIPERLLLFYNNNNSNNKTIFVVFLEYLPFMILSI